MKLTLYHGSPYRFDQFQSCSAGLHFGTYDQAVHAATIKLGRIPPEDFAALEPGPSGWRGTIAACELKLSRLMRADDPRTPEAWEALIEHARWLGYDAILYTNEFEGREQAASLCVFDAHQVLSITPVDSTHPIAQDCARRYLMNTENPRERIEQATQKITAILEKYPAGMATSYIAGHLYWLGDGELWCSADAILEGQPVKLPIDDINTNPSNSDFDGLADEDIHEIADAMEAWLDEPVTVCLADEWPLVPTWYSEPSNSPSPG